MSIAVKNPTKQRAGKLGAARRWGDPGVIRLDELSAPQHRLVLALVEAARAEQNSEKAPAVVEPSAEASEVRRASVEPAA